jgi:isopenicillin N synthase-like dioxygenase
VSSD